VGEIEADESFIGGKARFMNANKRAEKIHGRGPEGKAIVAAVLERGGQIRAEVVPTRRKKELYDHVVENVEKAARYLPMSCSPTMLWIWSSNTKSSTTRKSTFAATSIRTDVRTSGAS